MFLNIAIGCGLVVLTTFIHAAAMVGALRGLKILRADRWGRKSLTTKASAVAALVPRQRGHRPHTVAPSVGRRKLATRCSNTGSQPDTHEREG